MSSLKSSSSEDSFAFRILGPVEVMGAGGKVHLTARQLTVLCALLVKANRTVGVENIVEALWDDQPPMTYKSQVQFCVHVLRTQFASFGVAARIITEPPGYRLEVDTSQVDAGRFEQLVAEARSIILAGGLPEGGLLLRHALDLWRGPLLESVRKPVRDQAMWLDELWREATEELYETELNLGRHREVVGVLQTLVGDHPLAEQFRYLLMLALHRCGRQVDAIEVFRSGREIMVEELGLDPSEKLQALEAAIVAGDNSMLESASTGGLPAAKAEIWGQPRQLPAGIADLTGRGELVREIVTVLGAEDRDAVVVLNLFGKAGVGKSVLAVHVAHRLAEQYPDGQFYVSLASARGEAAQAHAVLGRFLRALGLDGASLPVGEAERSALYRTMLAGRRMLVVLEDVPEDARLESLIPGSSGCAVIATSRAPLPVLAGAAMRLTQVDVLEAGPALELMEKLIGPARVREEPEAAAELVASVGYLPLALRIVGARLAGRPHWTVRTLVSRLADERRKLDELAHGEMVVRSSIMLTFDSLSRDEASLLCGLSVVAAPSMPAWIASCVLAAEPESDPLDCVDLLVDAQLLDTTTISPDLAARYCFHDLIRVFAREQFALRDGPAGRALLERVLGGWLALADHAHRRLYGGDYTRLRGTGRRWQMPADSVEEVDRDPLRWLEAERANICAAIVQGAVVGLDELCWDLATSMVSLFEVRGHHDDWLRTHTLALESTGAASNLRGTAALQCSLGSLHLSLGRLEAAQRVLEPARVAFEVLRDDHGLALVHRNFGLLEQFSGRGDEAAVHFGLARTAFESVGDVVGLGTVLGHLAQLKMDEGDYRPAHELLDAAVGLCAATSSPRILAQIRYKVGRVMMAEGEFDDARVVMSEVLDLVTASEDVRGQYYALHVLGVIETHRGNFAEAARLLHEAIARCESLLDRVATARVEIDLALLEERRGDLGAAQALRQQAAVVLAAHGFEVSSPESRRNHVLVGDGEGSGRRG